MGPERERYFGVPWTRRDDSTFEPMTTMAMDGEEAAQHFARMMREAGWGYENGQVDYANDVLVWPEVPEKVRYNVRGELSWHYRADEA